MEIRIKHTLLGRKRASLTTHSTASSYGLPVLLVDRMIYGPADLVVLDRRCTNIRSALTRSVLAATLVATWGRQPERTAEEREAARLFLLQAPDLPQL